MSNTKLAVRLQPVLNERVERAVVSRQGAILFDSVLYVRGEYEEIHSSFRPMEDCPAFVRKAMGIPFGVDLLTADAPAYLRKRLNLKLVLAPK